VRDDAEVERAAGGVHRRALVDVRAVGGDSGDLAEAAEARPVVGPVVELLDEARVGLERLLLAGDLVGQPGAVDLVEGDELVGNSALGLAAAVEGDV
jgi:hypothetical protein